MTSLTVTGLGKRYLTSRAPSPFQQLWARLRRTELDTARRPRELWALKDVSFSVEPGTILGVIGPNGAGKTTLLKVLARITPPTEGLVIGRGAVAPLLELGAGLQAELTARENIQVYATWHGIASQDLQRRMDEIVEFAEIDQFVDTPLKRFSSGMYVRLAFSIAVNMQPDILLADEILAVGDIGFQERCLKRVQEAGEAGMTVFFVSHDMAAIQRLCDRVILLNAGRIVRDGDPAEVVAAYEQAAWTVAEGQGGRRKRGSHVNEYGEIVSVKLRSATGSEIGVTHRNQEADIAVTVKVATPGIKVRCALNILTRGILAFRAIQADEFTATEPGTYVATVRIPSELLAENIYTVKASGYLYIDGEERALVLDNALTFRVYGDDGQEHRDLMARGIRGAAWAGVVAPRLEWQVARQRGGSRVAVPLSS